mmetsp:Transcript_32369/g.75146  ORF Transcript_32369/g.75146 Transcript_32369/m.75146 type:complete len:237 (+) Transcript_32369:353-1063(+)
MPLLLARGWSLLVRGLAARAGTGARAVEDRAKSATGASLLSAVLDRFSCAVAGRFTARGGAAGGEGDFPSTAFLPAERGGAAGVAGVALPSPTALQSATLGRARGVSFSLFCEGRDGCPTPLWTAVGRGCPGEAMPDSLTGAVTRGVVAPRLGVPAPQVGPRGRAATPPAWFFPQVQRPSRAACCRFASRYRCKRFASSASSSRRHLVAEVAVPSIKTGAHAVAGAQSTPPERPHP